MSENNKTHWKYEYGMKVVYVFGSNEAGRHGKGYALVCKKKYGAIQGRGFGLQGMCYAIPTKDGKIKTLPLSRIKLYVDMFIEFAKEHNDMYFKVSNIGCGLAGYTPEDIAPLFVKSGSMPNIEFDKDNRFNDIIILALSNSGGFTMAENE